LKCKYVLELLRSNCIQEGQPMLEAVRLLPFCGQPRQLLFFRGVAVEVRCACFRE